MMEAIILAGGLGTRLQSVVSEVPKCMAPVAGQPFLHYLIRQLERSGFSRIILSLGYKHEVVERWLAGYPATAEIATVIEHEPLGTGGGVKLALQQALNDTVFVVNGDTYLDVDFAAMRKEHEAVSDVQATIALQKMRDFDRYGVVDCQPDGRIVRFREKQHCEQGLINGGVYLLARQALDLMPERFSLEKDYFEPAVAEGRLRGVVTDGYFIDIGVPEDYARAQKDFSNEHYF